MAPRPGPRLGGSVAILLFLLLAPDAARAQRSVADLLGRPATPDGEPTTILYTGIDKRTLAANFDFAGEKNDPALVALGTRTDSNARWGGIAGYVAYDWKKALRTVLRAEYFSDPQGVRSSETVAPGHNVDLVSLTATVEYKIWRGLVGRLEYRHDEASRRAFSLQNHGLTPTSHAQDTMTAALYYSFF